MKDSDYYREDCDEHRKKRTVTHWRRRQRQVCWGALGLIFFLVIGLTTRGYHRRHQARLKLEQQRIFAKFQKEKLSGPNGVRQKFNGMEDMEKVLPKNRFQGVQKKWEQHLDETKQGDVFENTAEHEAWQPEENTWDQVADGLGSVAETVGAWMHENAEPYLGEDLVHNVAESLHGALDVAGDFADDISLTFGQEVEEWGQALYEMLGATTESVSTWMESLSNSTNGTESWTDWSTGFFRAPASFWNYTTEQEEQDDNAAPEQEETTEETFDKSSIAYKLGRPEPRPLADGVDLKFAFVTTGFPVGDQEWKLETYILQSLNTWLQDRVMFYIVSTRAKKNIQTMCAIQENEAACERLYPIYVNCPTKDYGIATCCKQDKGMSKIAQNYPKFDWYVYHQDDLYFRVDYLGEFTNKLPNPQTEKLLLSSSPFRPHGFVQPEPPYTPEAWKDAAKRMKSNCSSSPNHIYPWGRPAVVYSNAALLTVAPGYQKLAISRECNAFQVSAGGGSPIVHWMYQLPVVRMPLINFRTPSDLSKQLVFQPKDPPAGEEQLTAIQKKRRADARRYSPTQRFLAFRAEVGRHNVTDIHKEILKAQEQAKQIDSLRLYPGAPYVYQYHRPNGFTETEIFKEHGYPQNWTKKWHIYGPDDCIPATLTAGRNMISNGLLNKNQKVIAPNKDIKKIQEQVLQKLDAAKQAEGRKKLEERQKNRQKVLNELSPDKKKEMLERLELVKAQNKAKKAESDKAESSPEKKQDVPK